MKDITKICLAVFFGNVVGIFIATIAKALICGIKHGTSHFLFRNCFRPENRNFSWTKDLSNGKKQN